jgi:EAL domain-containing protein (putative c-di-GMP-specific phosphodiesterase class I)
VAERLLDVLKEPFQLHGSDTPRTVTASIGVAAGQADAQKLLRDADIALYEAKYAGKSCFVQFEDRMHDDVDSRIRLDSELRGALDAHQYRLYYQPTFGIHDTTTTGVEALLRWEHPERGIVQPGEFLPLLEDTGLIVPVGRWVLHEACRQGAIWHDAGHEIMMSVNASARQMAAGTLFTDVRDALDASGFNPSHLVVEITEGTLMHDSDLAVDQLKAIKAMGVRVAIDDFGTGYSSLAYLRQFPVDILKIDRSFITDLTHSHDSLAVVHALIQLGKTLGLETVAEGIEHEDQLLQLREEDCDTGQGFLISKPLPPEELSELLDRAAEAAAAAPKPKRATPRRRKPVAAVAVAAAPRRPKAGAASR